MTSRERILAAFEGKPVDRVPISPRIWRYGRWKNKSHLELARELDFDLLFYGAGELATPLSDSNCEVVKPMLKDVKIDIRAERQQSKTVFYRQFHTPGGKLNDVILNPDPGGEYGIKPNHEWLEPLLKTKEDIELLGYLLPDPKYAEANLAAARKLDREIGDRGLVAYRPSTGVDEYALSALGPEQAMVYSMVEPELWDRTIEIVDQWHCQVMKLALENGWKAIFDAFYNSSLSVGWSPDYYRCKVAPLIKKHADLIHSYGAKMLFYDDGKLTGSIGYIIDSGVDFIQTLTPPPAGDLDFKWLAKTHGGRVCLNGGIDVVKMRFGKPAEIERDVTEIIENLGPTRKFILGTTGSITEGTPEENILAYFDTACKHCETVAKILYN